MYYRYRYILEKIEISVSAPRITHLLRFICDVFALALTLHVFGCVCKIKERVESKKQPSREGYEAGGTHRLTRCEFFAQVPTLLTYGLNQTLQ